MFFAPLVFDKARTEMDEVRSRTKELQARTYKVRSRMRADEATKEEREEQEALSKLPSLSPLRQGPFAPPTMRIGLAEGQGVATRVLKDKGTTRKRTRSVTVSL